MQEPFNLGDLGDPATRDGDVGLIDCYNWENPRILSHGEFDRQVKACARAIAARGLARGDRVAILSFNRAEVLIAYFAIMRAGLVAVPVNVKFPHETIAFIVGDAQIKFAFCDAAGRALLPADIALVDFDATGVNCFESFLDFGPFETIRPKLREAAMVLYTSGSTGRPKGVPLSQKTVSFGRYGPGSARGFMAARGCWWPPRCFI